MLLRNALFTLLALVSAVAHSEGSPGTDGAAGEFQDDLIARLEGNWHLTRKIRGTEVRNDVAATWILNHRFLQMHMKDVETPPAYEALVLVGYVPESGQYVAHWCDTYGGKFSAMGTGVRSGNTVEFRFAYPDGPFFNTFTWSPDRDQWVMRLESQDSTGKRSVFAIDTLDRVR
jgi:hypothetical protein